MEEKKQGGTVPQQPQRLSYEKLQETAGDLYHSNQKMQEYIHQLQEALEDKGFNYTSFFLSMLFKVVEHAEMYPDDFLKWSIENIVSMLTTFGEELKESQKAAEPKEAKKDEAK